MSLVFIYFIIYGSYLMSKSIMLTRVLMICYFYSKPIIFYFLFFINLVICWKTKKKYEHL